MATIPAAVRALIDQELKTAVAGLKAKAAGFDGMDTVEANVELTNWLLLNVGVSQLATAAAALALELHRQPKGGGA
jgi:hypothetical protein